jgi:hypothetical protein
VRGLAAAVLGGLIGAGITRALMRAIVVTIGNPPEFTWAGTAFIALFYIAFLTPGAVALAWSRARWPAFVLGAGALAIAVQATGIGISDLGDVGGLTTGSWVVLGALIAGMAVVFVVQALVVLKVARGAETRDEKPTEVVVQ